MTYTTPTVAEYMRSYVPAHLHTAFETQVLNNLPIEYMGEPSTLKITMFTGDLDKILKKVTDEWNKHRFNSDVGC